MWGRRKEDVEIEREIRKLLSVINRIDYEHLSNIINDISVKLQNDSKGNLKENKEVADYLKDAIMHLDLASNDLSFAFRKLKK